MTWSRCNDCCINCGASERPHAGRGYCKICYRVVRKLEITKKWDLANPESLKGYPFRTPTGLDPSLFSRFKKNVLEHYERRLVFLRIRGEKIKHGPVDGLDLEYAFGHIAKLSGAKNRSLFHGLCGWFEMTFEPEQRRELLRQLDKIDKDVRHDFNIATLLLKGD